MKNLEKNIDNELEELVKFHGHLCFGLALGYRVGKVVRQYFSRAEDEELVAIVENDSCSIDAIQYMLGCTFGKGNLIYKDYGKHVYIFYSRIQKKAIKISVQGTLLEYIENMVNTFEEYKEKLKKENDENETIKEKLKDFAKKLNNQIIEKVLTSSDDELFNISWIDIKPPKRAKIYRLVKCEVCGEYFIETKGRLINKKIVCKECFEKLLNQEDED
ncbi:formylmethanofuran dehydrogenase subunit E region [Methanocaldococcus sp. FS406-22]|uniref:FmdE family protein n=1 Tax=Methanocaldococcus sp. (strain FS406-22) TaxID=644281 RepID=UPI0001C4E13B|nr:FmdE family protein [Methanocaldococcus sp. FS406-22]ADC68996.1 formylmethanofuran dehydrogenase subunit E region [Methanocaldococcus sp. FS406-22]